MKLLTYEDPNGYKHKSLVRDTDTDPSIGLLHSPPNLDALDWRIIRVTLHNLLLEKGILTMEDAQNRQNEFNQCVLVAVGKPLMRLYQSTGEFENGYVCNSR